MKYALLSLKITFVFYYVFAGVLLLGILIPETSGVGMAFLSFAAGILGFAVTKVHSGLAQKKYWAWVASIIISGLSLFSLFFPIGLMGLIGLLNKETRQAFAKIDGLSATNPTV